MPNEVAVLGYISLSPSSAAALTPIENSSRGKAEQQATDYRLVIEQGPRIGTFIYKTVDRSTGETVRQYPREEILKLIEDPGYSAGAVVNTST